MKRSAKADARLERIRLAVVNELEAAALGMVPSGQDQTRTIEVEDPTGTLRLRATITLLSERRDMH